MKRLYPILMVPAILLVFLAVSSCQAQEDASKTLEPVGKAYAEIWNSGNVDELDAIGKELRAEWPDWKIEAFEKLVSQEAQNCFQQLGYNL